MAQAAQPVTKLRWLVKNEPDAAARTAVLLQAHDWLVWQLLGRPVRVCEIDPGMVETEFSLVRFGGDAERAAKVYEGVTPLTAADVAECVRWVAARPSHVNVDQLIVLARDQAGARQVHRR